MSDVRVRVMVVDDQPQVLKIVAAMLSSHGYDVVTADCVTIATRLLATGAPPRAAVLDIDLPDGVGFDLVLPLRQRDSGCHIVMMTGRMDPPALQRAADLGLGPVLGKPFDRAALIAAVEVGTATATATRAGRPAETQAESEADADDGGERIR